LGNFGNKGTSTQVGLDDHGRLDRNTSVDEDDLSRMMEMAGVKKAKPDYIDIDDDGNKKESMKDAAKDKKETEVKESIFDLQRLWKAYKG
jgi:hypothetical protein